MISRFVLVGLVATLGISIPNLSELVSCIGALHEWTANGLASLDAPGHRDARPDFLPWTPETARRFHDLIEPSLAIVGIADELNRLSDGVEVPPPTRPQRSKDPERIIDRPELFTVVTMEEKLVVELERNIVEAASPTTSTTTTKERRHERPARGESQCCFSPGTSLIVSVASQWEPIEVPADPLVDIATTLNQFAEGKILSPTPRRPLATVAEIDQVFEGLPFAGSTVPETLSSVAGPAHKGSSRGEASRSPSPEVTRAVGLTGEALMAWFRVLRGPGDLRISSR